MGVLDELVAERRRQDEKWGEQNHADTGSHPTRVALGISASERYRDCLRSGPPSWALILLEEVSEAIEEAVIGDDHEALRAELVQVAAVAVAWIEALDRRVPHG